MKILLINDNYSHVGGAETYFFNLYKILRDNKDNPYLFSMGQEEIKSNDTLVAQEITPRKKLFELKNFKDISIWMLRKSISNVDYLQWVKSNVIPSRFQEFITKYQYIQSFGTYYIDTPIEMRLRDWITEINPSIIHIHNNYKYPISIYSSLRSMNIPVVKTVHDFGMLCPTSWCIKPDGGICEGGLGEKCVEVGCITNRHYTLIKPIDNIIKGLEKNLVRLFITPSKILKQTMEYHGFKNIVHLPNFINTTEYYPNNIKIEAGNVLYIGGLIEIKGVSYLIEAFSSILKEFPKATLNIVGSGPLKSCLENKAKQLGIKNNVLFHGKVPYENAKEFYQKANVIVVPSVSMDNSPLVIYEAMASGRPVVGSRIGGIPELIREGKTGYLTEPRDPEDIAEKVIKVLSDRSLAEKFGMISRETAINEYSPEKHYENLMSIYRCLTN